MERFKNGEIQVLVSTSVIEVGIDVANATIAVIEGSERFGLAQLHQLRGRVGRGERQSWCFLFPSEDIQDAAIERLNFFAKTSDGLEIAEYDLSIRGPGEVYGSRQSGIPNLKIASFSNVDQIKLSQEFAQTLIKAGINEVSLFNNIQL
jgi:ATP-dependent DNA helicase RecG